MANEHDENGVFSSPITTMKTGEEFKRKKADPPKFLGVVSDKDVSFPIQRSYGLEVKASANALKYTRSLSSFDYLSPTKRSKTVNQALLEFCTNSGCEGFIEALFKEPNSVEFELKCFSYIEMEENNPRIIESKTLRSGAELKSELIENADFKAANAEILRVKIATERAAEQQEKQRVRQNREAWYHQWKWLEKKRTEGEFNEFLEEEDKIL
jgi:hypothetical protein